MKQVHHANGIVELLRRYVQVLKYHAIPLCIGAAICSVGQAAVLSQTPLAYMYDDTFTYVEAAAKLAVSPFNIDSFRTPGFPLFLMLVFKLAGGVKYASAIPCWGGLQGGTLQPRCQSIFAPIVVAQTAIMLLTILECYVLTYHLSHRRVTACIVASLIGCNLYIISWERTILSELLSIWVLVTVFLCFEYYVRRPQLPQAVLFAVASFAAILARPFNAYLFPVLLFLLLIQLRRKHELHRYWRPLALSAVLLLSCVVGYMAWNGHENDFFGISWVTNINDLAKVMEYHMEDLPVDPKYAQQQHDVSTYENHTPSGYYWGNAWAVSMIYPREQDTTYSKLGAYALAEIKAHPIVYVLDTVPDILQTWQAQPEFYALYANSGGGQLQANNLAVPGISAYQVYEFGVGSTQTEPWWVNLLLGLSTAVLGSYWLLPLILLLLGVWAWRRPESTDSFLLFALAVAVLFAIVVGAAGAYNEFYRIRSPIDWAMIVLTGVLGVEAFAAVLRKPMSSAVRAPAEADAYSNHIIVPDKSIETKGSRETHPSDENLPITVPRMRVRQGSEPLLGANTRLMPSGKRVVIMGAGPAGLTASYELAIRNHIPVYVVEKDQKYVGGISRTVEAHGYRFDIGGHRFFSKSEEVEAFWTEILGDEMLVRPRLSRILYQGKYFDYPLKARNALFNLGLVETAKCMSSYAIARAFPVKNPQSLEDWVSNQFGKRLFRIFFKTYTEKVWGVNTKELSADWAAQRIKGLNLSEAIKGALLPKRKGKKGGAVIKTLIDEFRYPRLGPGEMWERVRHILLQSGQTVAMGEEVVAVHHDGRNVTHIVIRGIDGNVQSISGTDYISTLPIQELIQKCNPPLPDSVLVAAQSLKYRDFLTVAMVINKENIFPDNWIYLHDPAVISGRIQNFKNWSPDMVPNPQTTCLGLEYFCFEGDGLWTSSDDQLINLASQELMKLNMCTMGEVLGGIVVRQPKAYPVYDEHYKEHLAIVRDYVRNCLGNLQLVGRNGMHHYNNQDHSMMTALIAARNIANNAGLDPWKVNTDAEYHEESRFDESDKSGRLVPQRIPSLAEK